VLHRGRGQPLGDAGRIKQDLGVILYTRVNTI